MYTYKLDIDAPSDVLSLEISHDETYIAAACVDGYVRCYSARVGKLDYEVDTMQREKDKLPATCVTFRPESATSKIKNVMVIGSAKGRLEHYHLTTQRILHSVDIGTEVYSVSYRSDGQMWACGGKDGQIRIGEDTRGLSQTLHWARPRDTTDLPCSAHSSRVQSVQWVPHTENMLLSGGWDKSIQVWDTRVDHSVQTMYGAYLCGDGMRVCDDGYTVVTGSCRDRDQLQIFDLRKPEDDPGLVVAIPGHCAQTTNFYSLALSPTGRLCAAGATDVLLFSHVAPRPAGTSLIWEDANPVFTSAFSSSSHTLAVGGAGGRIRVFENADHA